MQSYANKMISVVHFSVTPLAGAPIRLVQMLNQLTYVNARLIDINRYGLYDHDVVFQESPETALALAQQADIIHLHNYLDCDSQQFAPIDFQRLKDSGTPIIRHFHSTSEWIAQQMGIKEADLLDCDLPSLVIGQYPERFFIRSRVVPNPIPHSDKLYQPVQSFKNDCDLDIFFSPTKTVGAFERRWDTKAMPEVSQLLFDIREATGCTYKIMTGRPLHEVLAIKQRSRIVVDDLATGSYHLTGLEGLAQGKPVLAFLDNRSLQLLRYLSGSDHCPFINVRLEDARDVLLWLLAHQDECEKIGRSGREWFLKHWNEKKLIRHFVQAYEDLLNDPSQIKPQNHIHPATHCDDFFNMKLPDLIFKARKNKATKYYDSP